MFSRIARRYDLANAVLSMGTHLLWQRWAIRALEVSPGDLVIDLCTGTGGVLKNIYRVVPGVRVIGVDFSLEMLRCALVKQQNKKIANGHFVGGDALQLPFADAVAERLICAYGIRNLDNTSDGLAEIFRILKPRGRIVILEFGKTPDSWFGRLFLWYSRHLLPRLGAMITGDREAYEYLPRTSQLFPAGQEFCRMLEGVGFTNVRCKPLTGGIAYLYQADKMG